ncbi:MAG TPA: DUF1648 domain-containing protein [Candidatus Krumholzibacteria bacterium]|nr:DUF1648 domain-containing protein [Candidatus Krumholzibacteria bacterium]HPD73373.1 DUF1648 domain-containing protein [Candidatus Krumholzibacteria bacterium]HRY42106.1 DUF1648 domain-containing protein [Candidatus Krumholzibacteria bacterium]
MLRNPARVFFLSSLLLCFLHLNWAAGELPDRVATHFGAGGRADGWADRSSFLLMYGLLVVGMSAILGGIGWFAGRLPVSWLNLPNRDHWFEPQRRAATEARLRDQMLVMAGATNLFFLGLMHVTVQANRQPEPQLGGGFWVLFAAYLAFVAGWSVRFTRGYRVTSPR